MTIWARWGIVHTNFDCRGDVMRRLLIIIIIIIIIYYYYYYVG
jgi:hypothetical protein